jgi:hypothetical protein
MFNPDRFSIGTDMQPVDPADLKPKAKTTQWPNPWAAAAAAAAKAREAAAKQAPKEFHGP